MLASCQSLWLFAVSALQVVRTASEECRWPSCVIRCEACQHADMLGDCEWTVLNVGASCPKREGETECLLGKCTCEAGYCPVNVSVSKPHKHGHKVFQTCIPQVCHPGARPEGYQATVWTRIFSGLIGNPDIPQDVNAEAFNGTGPLLQALTNSEDTTFPVLLIIWPSLLILVGIVVTAEMLYSVECKANVKVKEIMANHMQVTYSEKVVEGGVEAFHMDDAEDFHHVLHVELDDIGGVIDEDLESSFQRRIAEFLDEKDLKGHFFSLEVQDVGEAYIKWPGKLPRNESRWPMKCRFEPKHHDYVIKKPHPGPMLALAMFTLALALVVAMVMAHRELTKTMSFLDQSLGLAHSDAVVVAREGRAIREASKGFNSSVQELHSVCRFDNGSFIGSFMSETTGAVDGYNKMIADIQDYLESAPSKVEEMHKSFKRCREWLAYVPLMPTILVTLLCAGMVMEAVVVRLTDRSAIAHDVDITLRVAAFLFALGILSIAIVGAAEWLIATFLSLFCMDADQSVVNLVENSNYTDAYNITRHYVYGDVLNPIMQNVQLTDKMIFDLMNAYSGIPSALKAVGEFVIDCPVTKFFHVSALAKDVRSFVQGVAPLFDNAHIYPYYRMIIREGMCGSFVDGLGWILLAQLIVGLVCFPLCVYFTHQYLTDCFIWEWAKEHAENAKCMDVPIGSRTDSGRTDSEVTTDPITSLVSSLILSRTDSEMSSYVAPATARTFRRIPCAGC